MTSSDTNRLGLIAGGGQLPVEIAGAITETSPFIIRVREFAEDPFEGFDSVAMSVGQIGGMIKALRAASCDRVCFAGYVKRPDLKQIKMDARGLIMVPKALAAGRKGDDAIIRVVVGEFESAGFDVVGADEIFAALTPEAGILGTVKPDPAHADDIEKAIEIARSIGALDIGQGAVVADGVVLAVEAQEGTNAMLKRVADLPEALRGTADNRRGVLAKLPKPIQERRVDLPTVGVETVRRCAEAGLAGIALEAGGALIVNRANVLAECDRFGIFVVAQPTTDA
jgi:DUF1009 family protein